MSNKAKIWLYKEGNECTTITGGWDELSFSIHTKYVRNYAIKELDNIFFNVTDKNGMCRIGCVNEINFSEFNSINIDINSHFTKKIDETYAYGHIGTSKFFDSYEIANISICDKTGRYVVNSQIDSNENGYISIFSATYYSTGLLNKLNIYNVWLNAKEDVISINSQDDSSISFDCNNLNNLISLTQVDILANGRIIQTYTENLDSITYEFDDSLMDWGNNEISIQAIYTQGDGIYEVAELVSDTLYVREVILEEFDPIIDLPSTSTLKEVVQRFSVIESANKAISNNLKNLLESKGFEVGDTPRLSNMVKLVNELSNNNSAEITEYINRITALENEVDNNKLELYNALVEKNLPCTQEDSFESLLSYIRDLKPYVPKLYLYNEGDQCTNITGGFSDVFQYNYSSTNNTVVQYNTDHIYFKAIGVNNADSFRTVYTVKSLNLQSYTKLYVEYEIISMSNAGANGEIGLDTNRSYIQSGTSNVEVYKSTGISNPSLDKGVRLIKSMDISSGNTLVYPYININTNGYSAYYLEFKVYKLWVE